MFEQKHPYPSARLEGEALRIYETNMRSLLCELVSIQSNLHARNVSVELEVKSIHLEQIHRAWYILHSQVNEINNGERH